jgi:hypothetical protein
MIRGLLIRTACFLIGVVPLSALPHIFNYSDELQAGVILLYLALGGSYLALYCIKRQDEIPTRADRS